MIFQRYPWLQDVRARINLSKNFSMRLFDSYKERNEINEQKTDIKPFTKESLKSFSSICSNLNFFILASYKKWRFFVEFASL